MKKIQYVSLMLLSVLVLSQHSVYAQSAVFELLDSKTELNEAETFEAGGQSVRYSVLLSDPAPTGTKYSYAANTNGQCLVNHLGKGADSAPTKSMASSYEIFARSPNNLFSFLALPANDDSYEGKHACVINVSAISDDGGATFNVTSSISVSINDDDMQSIPAPTPTPTASTKPTTNTVQSPAHNTNASTNSTANQIKVTEQQAIPPAAPAKTSSAFRVGEVSYDLDKTIEISQNKDFTISGKTIPNGIVTLTIKSKPRVTTINADTNGDWNFKVSGLEVGVHHAYAKVTDPVSKLTSTETELMEFAIVSNKKLQPITTSTAAASSSKKAIPLTIALGGLMGVLALGGAGYWFARNRKLHQL